jgi:hypothetical protein
MPEIPKQEVQPVSADAEKPKSADVVSPEQMRAQRTAEIASLEQQVGVLSARNTPDRPANADTMRQQTKLEIKLAELKLQAFEDQRKAEADPLKRLEFVKQQKDLRDQMKVAQESLDLMAANLVKAQEQKIAAASQRAKELIVPIAPTAYSGGTGERLTRTDLSAMNTDRDFLHKPGGDTPTKPVERVLDTQTFDPERNMAAGKYRAVTPEMIKAANEGRLNPDGSIMEEVSPLSADDTAVREVPPPPQNPKGLFGRLFG